MRATNDLSFVQRVVERLNARDIRVWVFGGWAEERLGHVSAGPHGDVDLLYRGGSFDRIDALIRAERLPEIPAKRFHHKRALELDRVMVELFLVEEDEEGYFTEFWGRRHCWPDDVLADRSRLPVASAAAVSGYRAAQPRLVRMPSHA